MKECARCVNCRYKAYENGDMVCENGDSEYFEDYIEPNHVCIDFEGENDE